LVLSEHEATELRRKLSLLDDLEVHIALQRYLPTTAFTRPRQPDPQRAKIPPRSFCV
jgi:hypothetical protein